MLYTSEVVAEGSAGRVGIWDSRDYRRLGEWDSAGIGPHELRVRPDGALVVANGGIATDPEDRTPLNLDTMRANLAVLDAEGALLSRHELAPELARNSIRHLALTGAGVAFAMQWQGEATEPVPLLGLAQGDGLTLCPAPEAEALAMQGYAGSIAANAGLIAVTSPRGGVAMIHDAAGEHRNRAARAMSSGRDMRPIGMVATNLARFSGVSGTPMNASSRPVSPITGQSALTRRPKGASMARPSGSVTTVVMPASAATVSAVRVLSPVSIATW
mgnify:CR=1 FL=1